MVTTVVGLGQQGAALAQELVGVFAEEAGHLREGLDEAVPVPPLLEPQRLAEVLVVAADHREVLR